MSASAETANRQQPTATPRTRRVLLGHVTFPHYVLAGGSGVPGGYRVMWQGKKDWCQPTEFVERSELEWHLERRLALAGLESVSGWPEIPRHVERFAVWVLVRRLGNKPFRKRAYNL